MKFNVKILRIVFFFQMVLGFANANAQNFPYWNDVQAFKKQDSIAPPTHYKTLFIGSSSFSKHPTFGVI